MRNLLLPLVIALALQACGKPSAPDPAVASRSEPSASCSGEDCTEASLNAPLDPSAPLPQIPVPEIPGTELHPSAPNDAPVLVNPPAQAIPPSTQLPEVISTTPSAPEVIQTIPGSPHEVPVTEETPPTISPRKAPPVILPPAKPEEPSSGPHLPPYQESWELKKSVYDQASAYFEKNKAIFKNQRFVTIVDMSQRSNKKRFYLFSLRTGKLLERHKTAHGEGSDPGRTGNGFAKFFYNEADLANDLLREKRDGKKRKLKRESHKTALGPYVTLEPYMGKHGYSLFLHGLGNLNSTALKRFVVVHGADYVDDGSKKNAGRSWGCPALDPRISRDVIGKITGGSLLFIGR